MNIVKVAAAVGVLCLPLAAAPSPARAASAHNSQAGADGDTRNAAAPIREATRAAHTKRRMKAM